MSDRPVPNEQHRESHSLKGPKNRWHNHLVTTAMRDCLCKEEISLRGFYHKKNTNNNLVEQSNVTMCARLPKWYGPHCRREFCSIFSHYPTGPELQTQRLLLLFSKKMGVLSTTKIHKRPFALGLHAVTELCVSLCLTSDNWTYCILAICRQEWCVWMHRD